MDTNRPKLKELNHQGESGGIHVAIKQLLGILAMRIPHDPPFPEEEFYKVLLAEGAKQGISGVVFHPDSVSFSTRQVNGYSLNEQGRWQSVKTDIPPLIYDRCFYMGKSYLIHYKHPIDQLIKDSKTHFLGVGLKGKWQLRQLLKFYPDLFNLLPPTDLYTKEEQIKSWLLRYKSIILKPVNGSLGAGVLKISMTDEIYTLHGRDLKNKLVTETALPYHRLMGILRPFLDTHRYLIQPYLSLYTKLGSPFDLRVLVQKNQFGQWETTGKAIRVGLKGTLTSNLHGGGRAYPFAPFIVRQFHEDQCTKITAQIERLEKKLPMVLEEHHGPLVELGIDFGIDRTGRVWLIEVNSKPGRDIFKEMQDEKTYRKSQLTPLLYAKYLMQSRLGG
jgi:glutathione synthase/RimK-type ligase-like ATP-grasp enzyme